MGMSGKEELIDRCIRNTQYHPPSSPEIVTAHENIRAAAANFLMALVENTPVCREQAVALTQAEDAMMWANAAVARNQRTL